MEIKWLEDFLAVASSGNFSRAAETRNVTQPAFSRQLKALELWTDVTLRDDVRATSAIGQSTLKFAMPAAMGMRTSFKDVLAIGPRAIALICAETVILALFVLAALELA